MNPGVAVKLDNISKSYKLYDSPKDRLKEALHPFRKNYHRDFYALRDINLEIKRGEVLGIVGKNGAGKSTLLKLICNVIQPNVGSVQVNGNISALLELGSGFNPDFTGIENIYFYGSLIGFSRDEMHTRLDNIVSFADIGDFIHQPIKTYSSGMTARLAFAVSINVDPDILVIDEVLSVGDTAFRRKCFAWLERFIENHKTIVFVSHNENSIVELCNTAIFIDRGQILMKGQPKDVVYEYLSFLNGTPQTPPLPSQKKTSNKPQVSTAGTQMPTSRQKNVEATQVKEPKGPKQDSSSKQQPFFIKGLVSSSKIVNRNHDIDIYDVQICTPSGAAVNSLVFGDEYTLSYSVLFRESARKVTFGIQVKTLKGYVVSGVRYPLDKNTYVEEISKNRDIHIQWKFNCNLLEGDYVIDIGVVNFLNNERRVLLGVYDALLFRVQGGYNENRWGNVSLNQTPTITIVNQHIDSSAKSEA